MALKEVLENFIEITKIPHCSGDTKELRSFLAQYAKNLGYEVEIDKAGNLLAGKNTPKICFQSHMDMVCVGEAPKIEVIEEDGYLKAKNSSLGADNGIGIAIMMYLMKKYNDLEFLFTNDEEIGLIGAKNLELEIKSKYLLNLDSEDDDVIIIGCAGGVDVKVKYPLKKEKIKGSMGKVSVENLPGGHSGVDIDKNIPNAIVELLFKVESLAFIKGGERRNSIPVNAYALEIFEGNEEVEVYDGEYLKFLRKLPNGVLEYDFEFKLPSKSINFALIDEENIVLSARANSNEKLEEVKEYLKIKTLGCEVEFEDEYPAWEREKSDLALKLQEITGNKLEVIHAGLECGILKEKFPDVSMASYGPNIENPHSIRERINIRSIQKVIDNIEKLLRTVTKD